MLMSERLIQIEKDLGGRHWVDQKSGKRNQGNDRFTWHNYAPFYEEHMPKDPKVIVEMGVLRGAGLYAWTQLFPSARVIGLDIYPENVDLAPDAEVYYFDQTKPDLELFKSFGPIDVFIDDALHTLSAQKKAFADLSPYVDGVYIVEDINGKIIQRWK